MVIDTSAVAAILFDEPEAATMERLLVEAPVRLVSAATVVEAGMVVEARLGEAGGREFDLWLQRAAIEVVPVDAEQAHLARHAWRRYGKGRHRAGMNYGDCFSYALAIVRDEPLLFKGEDFSRTDVKRCAD